MSKPYHVAFVLALLVPLTHAVPAGASPSSGGFKIGFSSQRSSSSSSSSSAKPSYSSAKSGGFGSFGRRPPSSDGAAAPARSSGGFGSFGGGSAAPRKSDSALSQQLNKKAAEANALRTLDARRQAQEQAARDTRPVPGYERGASGQSAPAYAPPPAPPQPQAPIVVRQDSGLGHVVAGAVLANAMRGAHANNNGYPGGYGGNGGGHGSGQAHGGTSFFGLFATLCVLALIGWLVYFAWRRLRRARDAKKPNYSFERN